MGVHGGHMDRSLSRFSVLVGSAVVVGALLAGCAANVPGPGVIAVPAANAPVVSPPAGDFLAGLEQAVSNELNAINSTQSDNEPPAVLIELNALGSESSLLQAETFTSLITTGANQIAKRERLVTALVADVNGAAYLRGVVVNGTALSGAVLAKLSTLSSQLQGQASSISSATLIDNLRSVITSIGPSTRVFGLVEPMTHLAVAGGEELNAANLLEAQYETLVRKVNLNRHASNYGQETARLQNLATDIATVRTTATAAVDALLGLSPAGYPGNRSTILGARAQLTQLRAPLGPLNAGVGDVNEIGTLLSLRAS
jgi:hypothetical protein